MCVVQVIGYYHRLVVLTPVDDLFTRYCYIMSEVRLLAGLLLFNVLLRYIVVTNTPDIAILCLKYAY